MIIDTIQDQSSDAKREEGFRTLGTLVFYSGLFFIFISSSPLFLFLPSFFPFSLLLMANVESFYLLLVGTGHVVQPLLQYPQLSRTLIHAITNEKSLSVRLEVVNVISFSSLFLFLLFFDCLSPLRSLDFWERWILIVRKFFFTRVTLKPMKKKKKQNLSQVQKK